MRAARRRIGPLAAALAVAVAGVAGCRSGRPTAPPVAADDAGPPVTYVAVGDSESVGFGTDDPLRDAWTQQLYRQLPRRTVFVNLGIPGASVRQAMTDELAPALAASPTLVTVWLNVVDVYTRAAPDPYESQLGDLVHQLRASGAKVLVANVPPLTGLPANLDAYNAAIARVAAREGAVLVDLHAAFVAARGQVSDTELMGRDGLHPLAGGHRVVATAFATALSTSGGVR